MTYDVCGYVYALNYIKQKYICIYIADADEARSSINARPSKCLSEEVAGVTSMAAKASSGIPERACLVHLLAGGCE